jgi:hypothetical protein
MMLRNTIKKILTGLTIPQEYICLRSKELSCPLAVILTHDDLKLTLDVTQSHLFLGYRPLILGLPFKISDPHYHAVRSTNQLSLRFECAELNLPSLAKLRMEKIDEKIIGEEAVLIYKGMHGEHLLLNSFHQWVNRQREKTRKQSSNNVSLPGNLIDQVRIAYSVPRTISIITVRDNHLINMFPTDLHGPAGENFYAGSLRLGGLANDQIEKYRQVVISEVEPSFYKQAYTLGKNHMRELQLESEFPLHSRRSKNFNFPLPNAITSYRELKKIDSFDYGIHRLHLYEVIHRQMVQDDKPSLGHIHQYYAQWRLDQRLPTAMLLR